MAIRRSNTAPQAFEFQVRPGLARAKSTVDGFIPRLDQTSVAASSHHAFVATAASPLASPRDRKDPFSLTGFFPVSYEGENWEWLRQEQTFEPAEDEVQSEGSVRVVAEDEIEETIKGEDKMGVLSKLNFTQLDDLCLKQGSAWWPIRWALHAMSSIV